LSSDEAKAAEESALRFKRLSKRLQQEADDKEDEDK